MIFNLKLQTLRPETEPHPRLLTSGMAGDVVQSLLQDAVNMNTHAAVHREGRPRFHVGYFNSSLPFHRRNVPVNRTLEAGFIEHHRMQRLRKATNFVERRLSDLRDFS